MKSIHKCLFTGHFHFLYLKLSKRSETTETPFWSHSPMPSCRKRQTWLCRKWDPVKFKVQTWGTSWYLCFGVLTGWTSTMPFDWYSDWPWCPSGLICFFQPRSPTGFSKKNHHVWLENLLMVFCHLVAIIHQSHRKPEGQGHWGEVNEPNVAHPLDPVSRFDPKLFCQMVLQKSCWKKWPRKVRKKKMSNEMCRQIWVKKAYWNYVPMFSISVIFSCFRNMKHGLFCGASSTALPFTCLPVLLAKHVVEVQSHLGATM